ncbi:OLC1v1019015C1 [Oldenlandia corymbosa var. corymbosa]|uniref:OLC1v1019015C1 n=1 Tax=Oldenlandia corymbosa var. corymbosa TaxID=529605 RepID=A0AAV1ED16_OLDCO|nr:OLC1v1019015C1 [Oldenlandia corymbosa var. corymbosa]
MDPNMSNSIYLSDDHENEETITILDTGLEGDDKMKTVLISEFVKQLDGNGFHQEEHDTEDAALLAEQMLEVSLSDESNEVEETDEELVDQEPEETLSGGRPDAETIAEIFLGQYYGLLYESPELVSNFYKDESVLKWPGVVESTTTMESIKETIMSSDYQGCEVQVMNVDAQFSLMDGVIITAISCLLGKDKMKKIISQTFFLAKQETGWFILNDSLCVIDAQEILQASFAGHDGLDESGSVAALNDSPIQPKSENEVMSMEARDGVEETLEVILPATEFPKLPVSKALNITTASASTEKPEGKKISYASMVAKETKASSSADDYGHKIVRVAPSSNQHPVASPKPARMAPSANRGSFRSRNFKAQKKGEVHSNASYRDDGGRGYDRANREFSASYSGRKDGRAFGYGGKPYPKNNYKKDRQPQNGGGNNSAASA